jgi:thiamine-monophosphate kinase
MFIEGLRRLSRSPRNRAVVRGIGDDCAILRLPPGQQFLVTTDLCIENVHFRRKWHPPRCIGHRCLVRGLSDIAAMGGDPVACFLSLGLPADLPQRWVDEFLQGLLSLAGQFKVQLAGGDTSSAEQITADIIVTGQAPAGKAILRSGARPGHAIYVTGRLGESAAVLQQLYSGKKVKPTPESRHFFPLPRLAVGRWLRQRGMATAMIDLSDGLSVDLAHICDESKVAATINANAIPVASGANLNLALHGGEDYELLFTAPKSVRIPKQIAGVRVTAIGEIGKRTAALPQINILDSLGRSTPLKPLGWQHFSRVRGTSAAAAVRPLKANTAKRPAKGRILP